MLSYNLRLPDFTCLRNNVLKKKTFKKVRASCVQKKVQTYSFACKKDVSVGSHLKVDGFQIVAIKCRKSLKFSGTSYEEFLIYKKFQEMGEGYKQSLL